MLVSLLALVIAVLSWFGIPAFRFSNLTGTSISNTVWLPQNGSFVAEVRDHVFKIPLVPKVLDCGQLSDSDASRDNSIRYAIPGLVFALSENPDTVDGVLDKLEDITKDWFALQNTTTETAILPIDHLLNLTSVLETDRTNCETGKDNLLDTIQTKLDSLDLDHQSQIVLKGFRKVVIRNLGDIAKSLQLTQRAKLNAAIKTWSLLLQDTPARLPWSDADSQDAPTPEQLFLLKRLFLWSISFTTTTTPNSKILTTAERENLILDKVLSILPLLKAMHVSNSKAHLSITTASNLVQKRNSCLGSLRGFVGRKQQQFDRDMYIGLKEMEGMMPMLMDQRRGQRVERKYTRSMARAREDAKGPAEDL
jgi:hypothetical protein